MHVDHVGQRQNAVQLGDDRIAVNSCCASKQLPPSSAPTTPRRSTTSRGTQRCSAAAGEGLALVGNDAGTPIIGIHDANGGRSALSGRSSPPSADHEDALRLWDSVTFLAALPEFHQLKRTRQTGPTVGERP